jgi:hypothetical protein
MIHKNCGGDLQVHFIPRKRLVIERGIMGSDHPAPSRYSGIRDNLMRCGKCNLIGIEHKKERVS